MRKVILWLILFLIYFVSAAIAQDCEKVVADYDGALRGREAQVEKAAQPLINEGADVRVRVVGTTLNLDQDMQQFIKSCPSWQARDGGQKNNLIVLMTSPKSRKVGMYIGGLWSKPLADHWVRIKQEQMAPRFRDGDFAGGFIAAEQHLAMRLAAAKDEALHPVQAQTVNQATDFSGLWTVMKWVVDLLGFGLGFGLVIWLIGSKKREEEKVSQAQQSGAMYKARCSALINEARDAKEKWVDNWVERFSEMSSTEKLNPETTGLSLAEYETIAEQWKDLYESIYNLRLGSSMSEDEKAAIEQEPSKAAPYKYGKKKHPVEVQDEAVEASTAGSSSVLSGNTIIAPVIVNERTEEDNAWHGGSHHSSWSHDDSFGSSSSDDSEETKSDDSGGSSDFGGSSDSGDDSSGGSSDFGSSSSDSGSSGGSSDF